MRRVVDVLICALSAIVWLPSGEPITADRFQVLVEERVRNFSSVADEAYRNILGNISQSCPYGSQLYDTCSITLQPNDVTFDTMFMRNISKSTSSVYFRQFLAGYATLFSSINDYKAVEDLFPRLCMSEALSNSWISLENNSGTNIDGTLWHFYGDDQSAIIKTYPYFSHDPSSDLCTHRQLDPRFRPWYVSTATSSKALYILLHSNNVDLLPLMRQAAVRIVNTLSHQDYFYILLNDDFGKQFSDDFVHANQSTRENIQEFIISSTQERLNPSINIARELDSAFQLFRLLANQMSVCHQVIMILSDSPLDQSIVDSVDQLKQQNDSGQQIDIYTMIFGIEADDESAALLSCNNGGDHYVVIDMVDVDEAVGNYYKFYSATVAMESGDGSVSWSEVYSDFFLAEDVLSACVPVWDQPTAMLLGVTCIDINVTYFTSLTNGEQVLSKLLSTPSVECPSAEVTEDIRNKFRTYRYCEVPANLSTVDQVIALYEDSIEQVINLLISARRDLLNTITGSQQVCPFEATVYDACSDDMLPYSFNPHLHNNVSNVTSNVNFSPTILHQLDGFSLVDYPIDNPLFESLCYSSVASRPWHRFLTLNPQATLQYYASEEGFVRLYPAVRYAMCYPPSYDPRTRPFYAATASGRKDVVVVIDITSSIRIPVATAAVRDILNTLSVIDYFNIITSSNGLFSNTGLAAATNVMKDLVNEIYLPNIVAMVSNQSSLVTMAFKAIIDGYNNGSTASCQIAIIVITDRQFTSETAAVVASSNTDIQSVYHIGPAKLFVTSLTDNVNGYYDTIAVQLTCNHSGIWNKVPSTAYSHNSTVSVISYYRVLATAVMVTQPVWSEIYEDYAGTGDVVTVCLPHYDESVNIGLLLGVVCADLGTEMLQQVGASIRSIEALINQQRLLTCRPQPVPDTTLELLRPADAKCLSPPSIISITATTAIVTTAASSATPTSGTAIASATPTSGTAIVSATTSDTAIASATPTSSTTTSGSSSDDQLTGGAIAGIVIACLVVVTVLLIVLIGWYHYHNIHRYRVQGSYSYKKFAQDKEFHNNELSDALVSEVDERDRDEL